MRALRCIAVLVAAYLPSLVLCSLVYLPFEEEGTSCSQVCAVEAGKYVSGSKSCLNYGRSSTCGKYLMLYHNCDHVCQSGSLLQTCHKYPEDQQIGLNGGLEELQFTVRKCENSGTLTFSSLVFELEMTCSLAYCMASNPFTTTPTPTCKYGSKITTCSDYLFRKHGCYSDVDVCPPGYQSSSPCIAAYTNKYCSNFMPVFTTCNMVSQFDHSPYLDFCDDCNRPPDAGRPSPPICPAV
mmetsp:Transcript_44017/g.108066  ORF Transcript_44017/g.108066 Transcript_44017/m.108066 type:complete len:239 (+) Transcript_44017:175-891(+)|eukprot:CAMPEP_0198313510 /NCGR_PEP_ID=MMETSP1450-20131203/4500_1 /TAXON_ID=753684 ORGANISM="Madagascaria erythrocladiodes, Strain CCMP3234" /NCGR_SAMPLE_ID=MMETSP1450 /ASSEMBLY_ACC=CAM_ASM_001115 /LENGTH=238 /DNA_ID=CAMNT_0044016515 /DNA_START=149 /DNA_END=865 /DNA_ORIENTATION=+